MKIINDPESMLTYSSQLYNSAASLQELLNQLNRQSVTVGDDWKDEQYNTFMEYFNTNQRHLESIAEQIIQWSITSNKAAEALLGVISETKKMSIIK